MATDNQPYGIGSSTWPGLAKLMEEMGELQQVLGKVMACEGTDAIYWDGSSLVPHLTEELGDVRAALIFFCEANGIPKTEVHARADEKLDKFRYWHQARTPSVRTVYTLLLLVQAELNRTLPTGREIESWSPAVRASVAEWAGAVHLGASDNDVTVPDMPDVLK